MLKVEKQGHDPVNLQRRGRIKLDFSSLELVAFEITPLYTYRYSYSAECSAHRAYCTVVSQLGSTASRCAPAQINLL
jgi:hypothetical protein